MNPIYAVIESPYRWLILAGIAFLVGTFGAMAMLAYAWPHTIDRIWLVAGLWSPRYSNHCGARLAAGRTSHSPPRTPTVAQAGRPTGDQL